MFITQKWDRRPHFLLLENNQHARLKFLQSSKKFLGADSVPPYNFVSPLLACLCDNLFPLSINRHWICTQLDACFSIPFVRPCKSTQVRLNNQGSYPFSETNFQDFPMTQINFSRIPKPAFYLASGYINNGFVLWISFTCVPHAIETVKITWSKHSLQISRTFQDLWSFSRTFQSWKMPK